jgi:predicted membrane-bound spermidine synthase
MALSIYGLKPRFQAVLRPMAGVLNGAGVTANQVTVAACLGSLALGALLCAAPDRVRLFLLLPVWLFVRMALVIADAALYFPFALLPGSHPLLVAVVVTLTVVTEMAGVLGAALGAGRRHDGPMGKATARSSSARWAFSSAQAYRSKG